MLQFVINKEFSLSFSLYWCHNGKLFHWLRWLSTCIMYHLVFSAPEIKEPNKAVTLHIPHVRLSTMSVSTRVIKDYTNFDCASLLHGHHIICHVTWTKHTYMYVIHTCTSTHVNNIVSKHTIDKS